MSTASDNIVAGIQPARVTPAGATRRKSVPFGDFFAFRVMVAPLVIGIIYALGVVALTYTALRIVIDASSNNYAFVPGFGPLDGEKAIVGGLALFLAGNLLWRLLCESAIVLFRIHGSLSTIERKLPG